METPPDSAAGTSGNYERALVAAGGAPWSGQLPRIGGTISLVIAADSGIELALQLGLPVTVVIGDMDSASPQSLREAERLGSRIERYPVDKDATDLELALDMACAYGARSIVVIGGAGGRISHLLGTASLLAGAKYAHVDICWLIPRAEIHVVNNHRPQHLDGHPADLVSLIPVDGDVTGISTTGLRWPLHDESLPSATTRGISNELLADAATIEVGTGTLLVIHEREER